MIRNYLKIALRNMVRNKSYSAINMGGLAVGMAVVMLIGLWIYDELSFEKYHENYGDIVQILEHNQVGGGVATSSSLPVPLSGELRSKFGSDFQKVAATLTYEQPISSGDKAFSKTGCYADAEFTDIISLEMVAGTKLRSGQPNSVLISESVAKAIFGDVSPINKVVRINNAFTQQVTGVFKNLPKNTRFNNLEFIAPIELLFANGGADNWYSNSFEIFAQISPQSDTEQVSAKIKNVLYNHSKDATKPVLFAHPMEKWHLFEFENGELAGGRIDFVWLFGIIGLFVLLLACINFVNLSTARNEKRAKEVGIRKAIGSLRGQLIGQFFSEALLITSFAFALSILLVLLVLPFFNTLSDKRMVVLWSDPFFLMAGFGFTLFTGLAAGAYPALYLSSFQPVKVLKGNNPTRRIRLVGISIGGFGGLSRKILVVVQFTVSITLIIGTIVVFQQIQYAKNRPIGYNRNGIMSIPFNSSQIQQYQAFRNEVLRTNLVSDIAASSNPTTGIWSSADNLDWKGKDPGRQEVFGTVLIEPSFSKVVEWQMKEGRSFSGEFSTDSSAFVFNEAAIRQMGLKDPVGETVKWHGRNWKIIGVVKDMVMRSPFDPITPTVFLMDDKERAFNVINFKIADDVPVAEAVKGIETVFKKFAPDSPFNYKFADQEYGMKFAAEERIGKLATFFAGLAIFISCLGLFGLASFVAEQRTREIGIRKVLGASISSVWRMLSGEFVSLVIIACLIATPISWSYMQGWLVRYTYRIDISWWIFLTTGLGATVLTLLTVSYQAIKAALMDPVKSLRSE